MYINGTKSEYDHLFLNSGDDDAIVTMGKYLYGGCSAYFIEALNQVLGLKKCLICDKRLGGMRKNLGIIAECCMDDMHNLVDARGVIPRGDWDTFLIPYNEWLCCSKEDMIVVPNDSPLDEDMRKNKASMAIFAVAKKWIRKHPELYGVPNEQAEARYDRTPYRVPAHKMVSI